MTGNLMPHHNHSTDAKSSNLASDLLLNSGEGMQAKTYFHQHQFSAFCNRRNTVAQVRITKNSIPASHQLKEQLTLVTKMFSFCNTGSHMPIVL